MISDIKPSTQKIGFSKTRALSGKLWTDYLALRKKWDLSFDMLTKTERDSLYTSVFATNNTMNFTDENSQSYTVAVTSENFDDNISFTHNGTLYYTINISIEQV